MVRIAGIDIGKDGAIVVIDGKGNLIRKTVTPKIGNELDYVEFSKFMEGVDMCVIEEVHAIFGSSAKATFSFGQVFAAPQAICAAMKIPYSLVQPKIWQREMFEGIPAMFRPKKPKQKKPTRDTKGMALLASSRLFPNLDLTPTERSKKPHDGIVDALLIAEYGRRHRL